MHAGMQRRSPPIADHLATMASTMSINIAQGVCDKINALDPMRITKCMSQMTSLRDSNAALVMNYVN